MRAAIALAAALAVAAPATAQPVDARMDRVLAERRTPFAARMGILRQQASEGLREASLAAQVCDKERLRKLHAELLRRKAEMEAEQSSWLPPYSSQFDPNLWGYVHNQLIHAVEQVAAWLKVDCVFPNVPLGPRAGGAGPATGTAPAGVIDDIDWWNRQNHEQWFESAEALRLRGDCAQWRALLDRIERELRRQMRNPTGPVDEHAEHLARLQRLWRHLMAEVRLRHCPPVGTGTTPEQQLIERRRSEGEGRARKPLPPFDQIPHRNSSGPPFERPADGQTGSAGTAPRSFCSEAERQRYIAQLNALAERAAENLERAARERREVEEAINAHVQKDQPVPRELIERRRRAAADHAQRQRSLEEAKRLRDRAGGIPVVDCGKPHAGPFDLSPEEQRLRDSLLRPVGAPPVPLDRSSEAILRFHNQLRSDVGSPPLRWNPVLAQHALEHAKVIAETGQVQHSSRQGRRFERENLALARRGTSSPMALVQRWGNEKRLFRPGGLFPNVCAGDWSSCAHYTQMIWSTTTDVGCAFRAGRQFEALICRYSPPGNQDGRPVTATPAANPPADGQPQDTIRQEGRQGPAETRERDREEERAERRRERQRERRPPGPEPTAPPELDLGQPQSSESVVEQLDELGAAGDLGYENPLLDQLSSQFNKAVRECDLRAFLVARERYLAELRRILSNPNLEKRIREHFERILRAVEQTRTPIKAPCPVIFR